ncbi:hypothetical protein V8B97DRAFT_2108575 [Scleroderma yunnanense]
MISIRVSLLAHLAQQSVRGTLHKRVPFDHLNIFVEPADWNEVPEKLCPITQLEVQVENLLDSLPGFFDGRFLDQLWMRATSAGILRTARVANSATEVKTLAEMEAYWERINFGAPKVTEKLTSNGNGDDGEQAVSPVLSHSLAFRSIPPEIEHLRKLAREGRDETLRIEAEEASSGINDSENGEPAADSSEIGFEDAGELTGVSVCQVDEDLPSVSDESSDDSAYETDSDNDHDPFTGKPTT